jgi:phosphatidylglycerophosphate synthase
MIDRALRAHKDRIVGPAARVLASRIGPNWLTALSLACGIGAGVAAGSGLRWQAVGLWLFGRAFDGLDGAVAREADRQSDLGGYLDLMADTIGYAAVPIGIAAAQASIGTWTWAAALLATFYVNTMSWTYLAAVAERRGRDANDAGERTAIHMPVGLVEGAETIVLFVLMLSFPDQAIWWFAVMAGLVAVTVIQRVVWAVRNLDDRD